MLEELQNIGYRTEVDNNEDGTYIIHVQVPDEMSILDMNESFSHFIIQNTIKQQFASELDMNMDDIKVQLLGYFMFGADPYEGSMYHTFFPATFIGLDCVHIIANATTLINAVYIAYTKSVTKAAKRFVKEYNKTLNYCIPDVTTWYVFDDIDAVVRFARFAKPYLDSFTSSLYTDKSKKYYIQIHYTKMIVNAFTSVACDFADTFAHGNYITEHAKLCIKDKALNELSEWEV